MVDNQRGWMLGVGLAIAASCIPVAAQARSYEIQHGMQTAQTPSITVPSATPRDVPYVPTPDLVVTEMLKLAEVGQNDVVYDLGSGDGRLVIAAVQQLQARQGVGVEIDPKLVEVSNQNAQRAGVGDRVQFFQQDLFQTDLSPATVITLYLLPEVNLKLRPKLLALKPGTRIVSHGFDMDDWKPDQVKVVSADRQRILYSWIIPASVEGVWEGTVSTKAGQKIPYTLDLTQQFQQVKGTIGNRGRKLPVPPMKMVGDRLTASTTLNLLGQRTTVQFDGKVTGGTLRGVAEVQGGLYAGKYDITAQRRNY